MGCGDGSGSGSCCCKRTAWFPVSERHTMDGGAGLMGWVMDGEGAVERGQFKGDGVTYESGW